MLPCQNGLQKLSGQGPEIQLTQLPLMGELLPTKSWKVIIDEGKFILSQQHGDQTCDLRMPDLHQQGGEELNLFAIQRVCRFMLRKQHFYQHLAACGYFDTTIHFRCRADSDECLGNIGIRMHLKLAPHMKWRLSKMCS